MELLPLRSDLEEYLERHQLTKKWAKARRLFEQNIRHPSLNVELMEPRWRGIYSFRIDQKYRALFFLVAGNAEVFAMNKHYQK